jgi:hypothetical protein
LEAFFNFSAELKSIISFSWACTNSFNFSSYSKTSLDLVLSTPSNCLAHLYFSASLASEILASTPLLFLKIPDYP